MQETWVPFLGGEDPWRRDGLPTQVFLDFPCDSAGKESACNAGNLGSIPRLGKIPWRRERLPTPVTWPGVFHGLYRPWGRKESDTTERFHFSNAYVEALTAIMTVFGGGTLGGNYEVEALMNEISVFTKRDTIKTISLSTLGGFNEKTAICKPGRGPSPGTG